VRRGPGRVRDARLSPGAAPSCGPGSMELPRPRWVGASRRVGAEGSVGQHPGAVWGSPAAWAADGVGVSPQGQVRRGPHVHGEADGAQAGGQSDPEAGCQGQGLTGAGARGSSWPWEPGSQGLGVMADAGG